MEVACPSVRNNEAAHAFYSQRADTVMLFVHLKIDTGKKASWRQVKAQMTSLEIAS